MALLLASLAALGAVVLGAGIVRARRRLATTRRLAAMLALEEPLRAGYSVAQAIALVARHSPQPTAAEFGIAAQEIAIGVNLADAMARLAQRTANPDYDVVSIIVRVQHEVGGNLAQILDSVGSTL